MLKSLAQTFGEKQISEIQINPKTKRLSHQSNEWAMRLQEKKSSNIVDGFSSLSITLTWFLFPASTAISIAVHSCQQMLCSFSRYQVCVAGFNLHQMMLYKNWHLTLSSHKPNLTLVSMSMQYTALEAKVVPKCILYEKAMQLIAWFIWNAEITSVSVAIHCYECLFQGCMQH